VDTAALLRESAAIRKSVLAVLGAKTNTPYHVWACWRVLAFLLLRLRENDLMFTLPQLFAMQNTLAAGAAPHNAARWTVLVGYLRIVSSIFRLSELRALAKTAWQDSRNKGVLCSELVFHGELVICKKPLKWQPKSKTAEGAALPVTIPRDKVIELLVHVRAIESNYPDAEAILRGEKDAVLPAPAATTSPVSDASITGASSAAQLPVVSSRAVRTISLANQTPPVVQVHDAVRYDALIHAILQERKVIPGNSAAASADAKKKMKPLVFSDLVASAQRYRQETKEQQERGLLQSASTSEPATTTTTTTTTTAKDGEEGGDDENEKTKSNTSEVINALASGTGKPLPNSIDWRAYVSENQRWPHIPQLPLF